MKKYMLIIIVILSLFLFACSEPTETTTEEELVLKLRTALYTATFYTRVNVDYYIDGILVEEHDIQDNGTSITQYKYTYISLPKGTEHTVTSVAECGYLTAHGGGSETYTDVVHTTDMAAASSSYYVNCSGGNATVQFLFE